MAASYKRGSPVKQLIKTEELFFANTGPMRGEFLQVLFTSGFRLRKRGSSTDTNLALEVSNNEVSSGDFLAGAPPYEQGAPVQGYLADKNPPHPTTLQ